MAACGRLGFSSVDVEVDAPAPAGDADAAPRTTRCDEQPMVFCDGFEAGALGPTWRSEAGAGTAELVTDRPWLGTYALRATAATGGFAYAAVDLSPFVGGDIYLRAYVYVPSGVGIDPADFLQFARVGRESDGGHTHVMLDSGDRPVVWVSTSAPTGGTQTIARDRWLCVTLHVTISPTDGTVALAIDNVPQLTFGGLDTTSQLGGFDELSVGLVTMASTQPQISIDVDEIAIATAPLACE